MAKGNYSEGFGEESHKKQWAPLVHIGYGGFQAPSSDTPTKGKHDDPKPVVARDVGSPSDDNKPSAADRPVQADPVMKAKEESSHKDKEEEPEKSIAVALKKVELSPEKPAGGGSLQVPRSGKCGSKCQPGPVFSFFPFFHVCLFLLLGLNVVII